MKIALIGYGKMGQAIERIALSRGHEVVLRVDVHSKDVFESEAFATADVAIEFTQPESAIDNYRKIWKYNIPVVSGTTGWTSQLDAIKKEIEQSKQTLFWASNFSLGVNVFFELNRYLAAMMNALQQYDVSMKEIHHIHKKDAPSGTAISIAEGIIENMERKNKWSITKADTSDILQIDVVREGEVNGTHIVNYISDTDNITISHEAKSRDGFALGAVLAAEFVIGKKGFYSMSDLFKMFTTNN